AAALAAEVLPFLIEEIICALSAGVMGFEAMCVGIVSHLMSTFRVRDSLSIVPRACESATPGQGDNGKTWGHGDVLQGDDHEENSGARMVPGPSIEGLPVA